MPYTSASPVDPYTFSWSIGDLSSEWNSTHYIEGAIFNEPFSNGQLDTPIGKISSVFPPSVGTDFFTPTTLVSNSTTPGNTYTVYGGMKTPDGGGAGIPAWFTAGEATFTMPSPRPSNWSWSTSKVSGASFNLTATEWNNFTTRIRDFQQYRGVPLTDYWAYFSGDIYYASDFNRASNPIASMAGSGQYVASSGSTVFASYLNGIRDQLNSIP